MSNIKEGKEKSKEKKVLKKFLKKPEKNIKKKSYQQKKGDRYN